ncbi:erythromycin esterase family protein [Rhodococcus sp. NPDC058505]|uniref:erythromycin esterase family protein n=1 Tax=Rhodococcus sp. NPDC058505 TaxID=3346531 RepID=UPI00365CADCD
MFDATALRGIGRPLDDPATLGRTVDDLLRGRSAPPTLLALGEPTHGIDAFPALRNDLLRHLVGRGFRSIVLETDIFAAGVVDAFVAGADVDIDTVLATGFSHGFGTLPGNRELLDWLRGHNAGRAPHDRVRFHGFDAPLEFASAPSPRHSLSVAVDHLPAALRPEAVRDLDGLLGDEADWTNEAAMYDPTVSVGGTARARTLRGVADAVADALHHAAPDPDSAGHDLAVAHARTARGLLRYHAAMATPSPDRIATLLGIRSELMAANLLAIVAREQGRGPGLVFAHNAHLRRAPSETLAGAGAGELVGRALGDRYLFVAADAAPDNAPGTLQGMLAAATTRRSLFAAPALRAALPPTVEAGDPIVRGHLPLTRGDLDRADAVVFVADSDGAQHRYW